MLSRLFLWFYCLPIPRALAVIALATGLFFLLHRRFRHLRRWKALLWLCLSAGCCAIAAQTVLLRSPGTFQAPVLQPLQSYRDVLSGGNIELLRSNFMNVVLFYPLGLVTALLCRGNHPILRTAAVTLLFILFSCAIEYAQLRFGLGLCEADDVLHNGLGAFLGALAGSLFPLFLPES